MKTVVRSESWPIRGGFRIARGGRTAAEVVAVELDGDGFVGRAECVPYARYGESVDSVCVQIEAACAERSSSALRAHITEMPPGAARNAVDCALWDWEAKHRGQPVWTLAGGRTAPGPVTTMRTVSVDAPDRMRAAAEALGHPAVVKVKVDGSDDDLARIAAVHEALPTARLVVDPNESWSVEQTRLWLPRLEDLGAIALEQPVRADADEALGTFDHSVAICADESFHDRRSFADVEGRYDMVNIKLDKAGGLTEALHCQREARERGLSILVGCMVCTSLGVAPALLLAEDADLVDLDGPLLLEQDRAGAAHDPHAGVLMPSASLWGGG